MQKAVFGDLKTGNCAVGLAFEKNMVGQALARCVGGLCPVEVLQELALLAIQLPAEAHTLRGGR